jgi:hypothetical protein
VADKTSARSAAATSRHPPGQRPPPQDIRQVSGRHLKTSAGSAAATSRQPSGQQPPPPISRQVSRHLKTSALLLAQQGAQLSNATRLRHTWRTQTHLLDDASLIQQHHDSVMTSHYMPPVQVQAAGGNSFNSWAQQRTAAHLWYQKPSAVCPARNSLPLQ